MNQIYELENIVKHNESGNMYAVQPNAFKNFNEDNHKDSQFQKYKTMFQKKSKESERKSEESEDNNKSKLEDKMFYEPEDNI